MSSLSIRSFTLFREEQPVRDALVLFTLTLLLHFLGAMLRLVQELSFFWPLNAVMAGIFARYVWLNRSYFYAVCFAAMLVYDGLTSRWGMGFASLLINFSNIVFIVTLAQLVLWDKRRADSMPGPINALNLFCFCLLAALLCAAVGALGSVDVERATFVPHLADWFSEQFSMAVLILPFILTLTLPSALSGFRFRQLLPVLALVGLFFTVSLMSGISTVAGAEAMSAVDAAQSGTASALMGTLMFVFGGIAAPLAGLGGETMLKMSLAMAICYLLALLLGLSKPRDAR